MRLKGDLNIFVLQSPALVYRSNDGFCGWLKLKGGL